MFAFVSEAQEAHIKRCKVAFTQYLWASESILFLCESSGICCRGRLFLKTVNCACFIETCYVATSLWVMGRNKNGVSPW